MDVGVNIPFEKIFTDFKSRKILGKASKSQHVPVKSQY